MKGSSLLIIVLMTMNIKVCAQKTSTPQVTITGKIIDAHTGESLEYATVILKDVKIQKINGGVTDENGNS